MTSENLDKGLLKILDGKAQGTVAIFNRGDFYTIYDEDAKLVTQEVLLNDVGLLKSFTLGDRVIRYLNLYQAQYVRVVREVLTILRFRVELFANEDEEWTLIAKGTPNNFADFEDLIGSSDASSSTMAVQIVKTLSAADNQLVVIFCDQNEYRITIAEFNDTPLFSTLEQCIIGLAPHEALLNLSSVDAEGDYGEKTKKLRQVLKRTNIEVSTVKDKVTISEDLKKFFKKKETFDELSSTVKECLTALFSYLKFMEREKLEDKFQICHYGTTGLMHLNSASVEALELFRISYSQGRAGKKETLFDVMNRCKTLPGQKMLREWIARPLCDLRKIEERQDVVEALVGSDNERQSIQLLLSRLPDLSQLAQKLHQRRAKLQDCFRIYQSVRVLRHLRSDLESVMGSHTGFSNHIKELLLEPLASSIAQFEKFLELIRLTVDIEFFEKNGAFRIKPDIDPELSSLSEEMSSIERKCERGAAKASERFGTDVKLEYNSMYGHFYRVTLKEEKSIRNQKGITILDTGKLGGVRFRDQVLEDLNQEYLQKERVYAAFQAELEKQVIDSCCSYASALSYLVTVLSTIDVLTSMAALVNESSRLYTRPKLLPTGSGILELQQCRHPVIEVAKDAAFIPNDVDLDTNTRMIVLTGANMGGKSTYLRAAALSVLMAQMGSFVPAKEATISLLDAIYTRVGASDQQCKGISTFMAEMLDSATILESATSNSLVIVDELGRGTSTFDGFGLAWAIASELLERVRCFCLFATHFHEMAALCDQEGAKAMQVAVKADDNRLILLYEVREGVAEKSFGLQVAKMVGFPEHILKDATNVLADLEHNDSIDEEIKKRLKEATTPEEIRSILSV